MRIEITIRIVTPPFVLPAADQEPINAADDPEPVLLAMMTERTVPDITWA
jgi:hypothetical protein